MTETWERGKKSVTYYNKEEFIPRRDVRNTIAELITEGDLLKKKADIYDSVEFVTKHNAEGETLEIYNIEEFASAIDDKRTAERKIDAIKKVCKNEFTENFAYRDSKFAEAILKILGVEG